MFPSTALEGIIQVVQSVIPLDVDVTDDLNKQDVEVAN